MIQREQMTELVNQQVADDRALEEQRARVDADVAVPRAAAPPRALQPDLNTLREPSDRLGLAPDPRLQMDPRLVEQPCAQNAAGIAMIRVDRLDVKLAAYDAPSRPPVRRSPIPHAHLPPDGPQNDPSGQKLAVAEIAARNVLTRAI